MAVPVGHARKYAQKCVKCRGASFGKKWVPEFAMMNDDGTRNILMREHIEITCSSCGYSFSIDCADKEAADEA